MSTAAQATTAKIIPFPRLRAVGAEGKIWGPREPKRPLPAIEWEGAWYHEAAIAEAKQTPHT